MHSWEYPNHQGIGCNAISPNDSANFLAFLQELRKDPTGARITLSAAVGMTPFAGPDGSPMTDVSGFAAVLDHIGGLQSSSSFNAHLIHPILCSHHELRYLGFMVVCCWPQRSFK